MAAMRDTELVFPHVQRIRASAGSGKTYALARRYLQFLLSDRIPSSALPNLLAVTFTNKATAEMTGRILQWLKILHFGPASPKEQNVAEDLASALGLPREELGPRALRALEGIFADHLDFSVETIDSFLSGLARGSAYELGLPPGAEVDLDSEPAVGEALALLLDRSGQDPDLAAQLEQVAFDLLDMTEDFSWDLRVKLAEQVMQTRKLEIKTGLPFASAEGLQEARKLAREAALSRASALAALVSPEEVKFRSALREQLQDFLAARTVKALSEITAVGKESLEDSVNKPFKPLITPAMESAFTRLKEAGAAFALADARARPEPFLRLLGRVDALVSEIGERDGKLLLDRVPFLMRKFLDNVGVPAAYFTWGERLRHFLVDEFQDTSDTQWACLKPLVEEALSQEGSLFFVGDRKQAIYGFRGGRPALFDEAAEDFACEIYDEELPKNYRSCRVLVEYHREALSRENLVTWLTEVAGTKEHPFTPEEYDRAVAPVFDGVAQGWVREGGYVRVERLSYPEGTGSYEMKELVLEHVATEVLPDLQGRGFAARDLCILVRKNEEAALASRILLGHGLQVASAATLRLDRSQVVRELVAYLAFLNSPVDDLSFATFVGGEAFGRASGLRAPELLGALLERGAAGPGRALYTVFRDLFPEAWKTLVDPGFRAIGYQPPYDLLQEAVARLGVLRHFPGEAAFVAHLLEVVKAREAEGENSAGAFLDFWNENPDHTSLRVPLAEEADAVRVMTIHKAKGLEFPAVVLPFLGLELPNIADLVVPEGGVLRPLRLGAGAYKLSPELAALRREKSLADVVEELNAFYVAITRAADELHVFLPEVEGKRGGRKKALPFPMDPEVLVDERGEKGRREETKAAAGILLEGETSSDRWRDKLHLRKRDFPGTRDPEAREAIERGKLVHRVLASGAVEPRDIEAFLGSAHAPAKVRTDAKGILEKLLAHPDIAPLVRPPRGSTVESEVTLLDARGELRTVDRLIRHADPKGGGFTAVEWKTGERYPEKHAEQIGAYCGLLREAYPGHEVKGVLVYVDEAALVEVP